MSHSEIRVVYVDPSPTATVQEALDALDATVDVVETTAECLSRLSADAVHCVLTTDRLPESDCVDLCRRVRSHAPETSIVACPSAGSEELAGELVAAGVDGYVPQSQEPETIRSRIDGVLEDHDPSDSSLEPAPDRIGRDRELEWTKTVVEAVGDSVYGLDLDGRFVTVNDSLTELTGYNREELVGEHVSTIFTDDGFERGRSRVRSLLDAPRDSVETYEGRVTTRRGEHVPSEMTATLLYSEGEPDGIVGIIRDVSDRKRIERELVDSKAKIESLHGIASELDDCHTHQDVYDLTVEAAEEVLNFDVCVVDSVQGEYLVKEAISSELDGTSLERMPIDEGIAGKTHRHCRTYRVADLRADDDAAATKTAFRSVLSVPIGDRGVFQAVSTEVGAFDDEDEELAELLLSHVQNALERIDFEHQLRTERDRFAALFENVPDAVVIGRHDDGDVPIVESINPAFERIFGYDESELVGKALDEFIVPTGDAAEARTFNRLSARGEVVEGEVKRISVDGLRDFMVRLVPVETEDTSETVFGLYTDVTERKRRRKRVEILNRVLRHDLRNGMNIVRGCAEMLEEAVSDEQSQYAEVIRERSTDLVELAEKTRAAERTLENGESAIDPIDVSDAVRQATAALHRDHPDAAVECSAPERCFARAGDSFETAIRQVIENAIEHNDRSTPTVEISLSDRPEDGLVRLSIADNGPGIPDEERELLEEDREITQLRHASGLGLWLVNWAVTQTGGRLRFEENDPRGTVVVLEVPRVDTETIPAGPNRPPMDGG
ncbi:PAS domain S-box protein [Natrarchaeobius chitinivorans]|uniref:PAS domain S-box protein n=1 Tax=Natrarchaeobius chitinivorans TaxID=1679083 RepID=UPI000F548871|nr:PAS domain S-box protein [Natrarchaeobius chitinivorans]